MLLEVRNVSVRYNQSPAIEHISFIVSQGDFIGLVGPNGGGKTTLTKAILGLTPISSGSIHLFGQPQDKFRQYHRLGYLPQRQDNINPLLPATVQEVVALGLLGRKSTPKQVLPTDKSAISDMLQMLKITHLQHKLFTTLSGGQQQRVLLARALVAKPELLILDEPSTALDPQAREQFFNLLQQLNQKEKTTIILITHDTGYIGQHANKLLYVDRRLVFFGPLAEFCPGSQELSNCFEKRGEHIIWHQHN